jgi:DNA-binding GntR family transcriptional regulator
MNSRVQRKDATLNQPERLRASDVAYSSIRQGLAAGRWAPGSHLRESELAAELGISRTPVREALRRLASEQLVSFEPHLGVRVPGWSSNDIEEIFALRVELESYAAGQAARHASPAQVAELRDLAGQIEKAAFGDAEPDYVGITELNNRFHGLIVASAGNQRHVGLVVQLVELPLVVRTFTRFDRQELARSVSHHYDLVEAIEGRNADWAVAVMRAHIHAGRQVMLRATASDSKEGAAAGADARRAV